MKVSYCQNHSLNFKSETGTKTEKKTYKNESKINNFFDKFETSVVNSADLNDTIQVPRTIFKGYMAFTIGMALMPLAALAKNKHPNFSNFLNVFSAACTIGGTYCFVRPYMLNSQELSSTKAK